MINIKSIENINIDSHDKLLSLTDLLKANKIVCFENFWAVKRINDFFYDKDSFEYIKQILELMNIGNDRLIMFHDEYNNNGLKSALKKIGLYKVTGRGSNKNVFCNPYVFIAVAQWLNPRFKAYVTLWITDELLGDRIKSGFQFNQINKAINNYIVPNISDNAKKFIFSNFAKLINKKVFGSHSDNLRQIASKEQLQLLNKVQTKLSALIEVGYLQNYHDAKKYLKI